MAARSCPLVLLASAFALAVASPARAEELPLKVENYVFAASEALADGEPALALTLLRRARAEAPGSCIVEEYLCRCYAALGNLELARGSYAAFAGCMESSDEGVMAELDALLAALEKAPSGEAAPLAAPAAAAPAPIPEAPAPIPPPAGYPGRGAGWAVAGAGAALSAALAVLSGLSFRAGERYVEGGQQAEYEALAPWNHGAVVGAGACGLLAAGGLGVELALARRGRGVAFVPAPWPTPAMELRR